VRTIRALLAGLLAVVMAAPAALAQSSSAEIDISDVSLQRYIEGGRVSMVVDFRNLTEPLNPSLLGVTINGQPLEDFEVEPIDQATVARGVVLVIDISGSMQGDPIEAAKTAAKSFIAQKRPEDFIALVSFNNEVQVLSNFTASASTLEQRIDGLESAGGTAMFDAVIRAAELYASATGSLKRNMIVLSDGLDEDSAGTLEDAIAAIEATDVRTFGVALESASFTATDLQAIADAGDGTLLTTTDPEELASLYGQIQRELNNTLVIRFNSPVSAAEDVDFGVTYGNLSAQVGQSVPGYVTTTTAGPATTTTYPLPTPTVVASELPLGASTTRTLIVVLIAAATTLLIFILLGGNREEGPQFAKRLAAYGRKQSSPEEKKNLVERIPLLGRLTASAEEQVRRRGLLGAVNSSLEQGNVPLTAGEAIAAGVGIAMLIGILAGLLTLSVVAALLAGGVSILLVFAVINYVGSREKRRFESQLPDTLTLLSTSLRAGYSLLQAIEAVAQEAPNPTAREFGRAVAEARLGIPVPKALDGITERTQSEDFRWAAMAIEIQREVGGNLAEVLQTVADTMMARNRLKGEIRALTAEGRISAIVLGALPFVMAGFLWVSNREYLMPLFENTFGQIAIGMGVLLLIAGIIWLRKIVNIEV